MKYYLKDIKSYKYILHVQIRGSHIVITADFLFLRFPLSVKITPSMAPVSELLLYYVRPDGEIVATTYSIKVGHCFENKVKSAWHTDAQTPGTATQYHVEAAPWSLCGISAVDKSTRFLVGSKANLIDADQTFEQLKRFYIEPELRPIWTQCKGTQGVSVIEQSNITVHQFHF